jgi:hypothetical protein
LPTSTERPRRRLAALLCAALAGATLLAACDEASVTHPTPTVSPTPFALSSLPPIGFNHRYGNNPVTAADAFAMERSLYARKQFWEIGLRGDPVEAGYVEETDRVATRAARGKFSDLQIIVASESLPTLRDLLGRGDDGQRTYCEQLVEQLRTQGYSGLQSVTMQVFFGESHRHSTLLWNPQFGYTYTVLDNNLKGTLLTPIPSTTPFTTPPPH